MIKPRRLSAFIRRILLLDPHAIINYNPRIPSFDVTFKSALAKDEILSEYDVVVLGSWTSNEGWPDFSVSFDAGALSEEPEPERGRGFTFDKMKTAKRNRRAVTEQEETGAELIGGQRHVGSGAFSDLKSDSSREVWQQEAKQTKAASVSVSMKWLDKITREARVHDKRPMLFVRFTDPPDGVVAEQDWVVIPATVFDRMRKLEDSDE